MLLATVVFGFAVTLLVSHPLKRKSFGLLEQKLGLFMQRLGLLKQKLGLLNQNLMCSSKNLFCATPCFAPSTTLSNLPLPLHRLALFSCGFPRFALKELDKGSVPRASVVGVGELCCFFYRGVDQRRGGFRARLHCTGKGRTPP